LFDILTEVFAKEKSLLVVGYFTPDESDANSPEKESK
jgi:hypothetical protein